MYDSLGVACTPPRSIPTEVKSWYRVPRVTEPADLEAFVRTSAVSFYHQVGTCAMGWGPMAVVDDRLAVHGLNGLLVADASVMPQIIRGHVGIATMMIAEKAADLLLGRRTPSAEGESA